MYHSYKKANIKLFFFDSSNPEFVARERAPR